MGDVMWPTAQGTPLVDASPPLPPWGPITTSAVGLSVAMGRAIQAAARAREKQASKAEARPWQHVPLSKPPAHIVAQVLRDRTNTSVPSQQVLPSKPPAHIVAQVLRDRTNVSVPSQQVLPSKPPAHVVAQVLRDRTNVSVPSSMADMCTTMAACHFEPLGSEPRDPSIVVIDAMNVARRAMDWDSKNNVLGTGSGEGGVPRGCARAVAQAIDFCVARGHRVHAILPHWAYHGCKPIVGESASQREKKRNVLEGVELLQPYLNTHLHLSPSGSDDDKFILTYALCKNASGVMSNDLYREHIGSGLVSRQWVEERRWPYMFIEGELVVLGPRTSAARNIS